MSTWSTAVPWTIAISLLVVKFMQDGFDIKKDWGDIAMSLACMIFGVLCTDYFERMKGFYNVSFIMIENRRNAEVFLQWGDAKEGQFGFTQYIPLPPNTIICRKVQAGHSGFSSQRPCVRISQDRNSNYNNATIILWEPSESYHTKVYQVTDDGITESRNPEHRRWHVGEMQIYQSGD